MNAKLKSSVLAAGLFSCLLTGTASASLVFDSTITIQLSAQGFGTAPRDLTIQNPGSPESGCVGVSGTGTIVIGPTGCRGEDATISGNGVVSVGGQEVNPDADNQKFGIPTLSSLGITSLSEIGILFNATEPSGNAINVTDITLKFFTSGGLFLASVDGQESFPDSFAGNGVAGFVFVIDGPQQLLLLPELSGVDFGSITLALESTITGSSAGPESFRIVNLSDPRFPPQVIPEPGTLALMGLALAGIAATRRRKV